GRVIQAVEVFVQPEDPPVVHADSLEHAVAIQETVVEHRDLGVRLVVVLAVDPDGGCHGSGAEYTAGKEKSATCEATALSRQLPQWVVRHEAVGHSLKSVPRA